MAVMNLYAVEFYDDCYTAPYVECVFIDKEDADKWVEKFLSQYDKDEYTGFAGIRIMEWNKKQRMFE